MKFGTIGSYLCLGIIICSFLFASGYAFGAEVNQIKPEELYDLSLEELLDLKITVASQKGKTVRESPGIVTVITQEEITKSGARDLIDILCLVPGFNFASDVQGLIGAGFRGMWGHEGKILLLVDGQVFNETLFSTTFPYGGHFPVSHIKQIEIIRGPGSAIYGGFAELAVINIKTKSPKDLEGVYGALNYGQWANTIGRWNISAGAGKSFEELDNLEFSVLAFVGQSKRSDADFTDFYGNTYNMQENAAQDPLHLNLALGYRDLKLRFIFDYFNSTQRDSFDFNLPKAIPFKFITYIFDARYDFNFAEKFILTPRFNYKRHTPWHTKEPIAIESGDYLDVTTQRFTGDLRLQYNIIEEISLLMGAEYYYDMASTPKDAPPDYLFADGENKVGYHNFAGYLQGLFDTPIVNIAAGARYEYHNQAGSSFVPRAGINRLINDFHFKLLFSMAFRAPGIKNMDLNPEILPERTTVWEGEIGYRITENIFVALNAYDIKLKQPIVYFYDPETNKEGYENFDAVGTRGLEFEGRFKHKRGYLNLSYSFYRVYQNKVDVYAVEGRDDLLIAFPAHKVTVNASIDLYKDLSLNPSLIFNSEKYGYDIDPYHYLAAKGGEIARRGGYFGAEGEGAESLKRFNPSVLLNLFLLYQNAFEIKDLSLGAGVYNLLGDKTRFVQAYQGFHAPIPGTPREYLFRVEYLYGF